MTGAGAVRAAATLLAVALALGACDSSPSGNTPAPAATAPPVTPPPRTGPSPPPSTPPSAAPLAVSCQADPRAGDAPLRVSFAAFPGGGTGAYGYAWDFGDGGSSRNPGPSHTYEAPGEFDATVRVTDGAQSATCSRSIAVSRAIAAPAARYRLEVVVSGPTPFGVGGAGSGLSCRNPPAPGDVCAARHPGGAQVSVGAFRASPAPGPPPVQWSGDCDAVFPTNTSWVCVVTMNGDKRIVATSF
jgi:PKD repeat protein